MNIIIIIMMIIIMIIIIIIIIILGLGPLYLSSVFQDEIATEFVWLYFLLNIIPDLVAQVKSSSKQQSPSGNRTGDLRHGSRAH